MSKDIRIASLLLLAFAACGDAFGIDDPNDGKGVGESCSNTDECRSGLSCVEGTCQPTGETPVDAPCQLTAECAGDAFCDTATRLCTESTGDASVGGSCGSEGDCEKGLACEFKGLNGTCIEAGSGDVGASCEGLGDCLAGLSCVPSDDDGRVCGSLISPDGSIDLWSGEQCEDVEQNRAYFAVPRSDVREDFYRLPFPNDIRQSSSGLDVSSHPSPGNILGADLLGPYLSELASPAGVGGFSRNPVVIFRFSKKMDFDSISDGNGGIRDNRIRFVNLSDGEFVPGTTRARFGDISPSSYLCDNYLIVARGVGQPLAPGKTYAVILTTDIVPDAGGTYERDADLDAMLENSAPGDSALGDAHDDYEPLRAWLNDTSADRDGVSRGNILNVAVFTTEETGDEMETIAEDLATLEPELPTVSDLTLCEAGTSTVSGCGGDESRECSAVDPDFYEIHGKISLPIFQEGTAPYETSGGAVASSVVRSEEVCFALSIPKDGAAPAEGWPLMVYAHGTGGSYTSAVTQGFAKEAANGGEVGATAKSATLTIDMPQHGPRRGDSDASPENLFFNYLNPEAARGNVTQGAIDLLSLLRFASEGVIAAEDSSIDAEISFDGEKIALFAHSQGATHASLAIPYASDYGAVVLSGNGGYLTQSLLHKTQPQDVSAVLPLVLFDFDNTGALPLGDLHPVLALLQNYFGSVDTMNYAELLFDAPAATDPGRHVFMTYGEQDSYSPEETLQAYASAGGFPVINPVRVNVPGNPTVNAPVTANANVFDSPRTVALRQYAKPDGIDGHFVATGEGLAGRTDAMTFLLEFLAGQTPTID